MTDTPTIEHADEIRKALITLRKDGQPGVSQVHVNAPLGNMSVGVGGMGRLATALKRARAKLTTVTETTTTLPTPTLKAKTCSFCAETATGDTDPPSCDAHREMATAKALSGALTVVKSAPLQFTLSPLYVPHRKDAHGEWTTDEDLQKAAWGLMRSGDRTINIQHLPGTVAGEWVELATWPWEHDAELATPGGEVRKVRMPANTPYMGVVWGDEAWEEVQAGRLRGLSMEGTARRVTADLPGIDAA